MVEHRRTGAEAGRLPGPLSVAGFLDLLLHQLPARAGRVAAAGGEVRRCAGRRRACTRRSSRTRRTGRAGRAAVERYGVRPPGARRPGADHLAALHGPGLADARAGRPGGLRRRAVLRRGPRARPGRAARRADRRARARRHAAPAATRPYVAPHARSPRICASRRRPSRCRRQFLVADAGHHSLVELAADAETVVRRIGTGERGFVDGGRPRRASPSPTACACCRPRWRDGRVRRGGRRHGQPPAARRRPRRPARSDTRRHRQAVDARRRHATS